MVFCEACTESYINVGEPGSKPGVMSRLWREERSVERELVEELLLYSQAGEILDKLVKVS